MPTLQTVVTNGYLNLLRDAHGEASLVPSYFRFGEGGWTNQGGTKVPNTPEAAQEDLDCIDNASAYPTDSRFSYEKDLEAADIDTSDDAKVTIICALDPDEGSDDGSGAAPEYYELGIYNADDVLMFYSTFPKIQKESYQGVEIRIEVTFSGE